MDRERVWPAVKVCDWGGMRNGAVRIDWGNPERR